MLEAISVGVSNKRENKKGGSCVDQVCLARLITFYFFYKLG